MSLSSFGALSVSCFWLFRDAVSPFPTRSGNISTFFRLLPWYLSVVAGIDLCCLFTYIVVFYLLFVSSSQLVVLSSLVGRSSSLPLHPLSLCPLRVLLLRSMTRSDLRFSFATRSPVGPSHLCFSLLLRLLLKLFRQAFVGCSLVFILVSVSGVFSRFFSIYAWFHSALCWWVSFVPSFLHFSFHSGVLDCW